ncbi:MAG: restriction endonuclease subunit S [Firmicutes bacterium]|nr:restriction endonuclease subunit S [Bacillota bacterium]
MREMKDSGIEWIGQIPKGWELRRVKTLFTQRNSKGNGIEVLLSPTQKYGVVPQSQLEGVVQVKEDTDLQMFKTVHKGDFVISLRSFQGGFEYSLYEGVCSPAYQVFYPTSPICDTYYRYLFKSQSFISKMNNLTVGIREGKNIQYVDFANSQIPVPPLAEQERIAAFLDAECAVIDAVLEKTRASIEEYKKLKQAVITQAVTKGIRGDRPMKDSGIEWIGDIPAEWDVVRQKYFWNTVESGVSVNAADKPVDNSEQYGVLKTSAVSKFVFIPTEHKQVNLEEYGRVSCPVRADSIIASRMNTPELVGACGYVQNNYPNLFLPDRLWQITFKDGLSPKYAWYYLSGIRVRQYISSLSTGTSSSMQNISQSQYGNIFITIPSIGEQSEITKYLDEKCRFVDALVTKKQQYLTEIENYKKSLVYEYVTGKKEVKTSVLAD